MSELESLDILVKRRLKRWGQRPPGIKSRPGKEAWLRGRPADYPANTNPFLKIPGSSRLRTLPDGLWLNFGGNFTESYVDILAIEACGTLQNLLDKRSRFAPSTHSLLAVCPLEWLLAPIAPGDATPRWQAARVFYRAPTQAVSLPVREIRVLYGLKNKHFQDFLRHNLPHAHEFFAPMEVLTREDSETDPALLALLERASLTSNFFAY
jgi:hypothetical protein